MNNTVMKPIARASRAPSCPTPRMPMPAEWKPGSEHLELRDEVRSETLILRRYYDLREPPEKRAAWQLNRLTAEGEKQVLRGAGHDLQAIKDALHRVSQKQEPHERVVPKTTSISEKNPDRDTRPQS